MPRPRAAHHCLPIHRGLQPKARALLRPHRPLHHRKVVHRHLAVLREPYWRHAGERRQRVGYREQRGVQLGGPVGEGVDGIVRECSGVARREGAREGVGPPLRAGALPLRPARVLHQGAPDPGNAAHCEGGSPGKRARQQQGLFRYDPRECSTKVRLALEMPRIVGATTRASAHLAPEMQRVVGAAAPENAPVRGRIAWATVRDKCRQVPCR